MGKNHHKASQIASAAAIDPLYAVALARQMRARLFLSQIVGAVRFLYGKVIRPLAVWHLRRGMFKRLSRLDDRTLADIGVDRWEIPAIVKAAYPMAVATAAAPRAAATLHRLETAAQPAADTKDASTKSLAA